MGNLTGWHAVIILAVVLLIFGAAKLPALAKSVGQSVKILKKEVHSEPAGTTSTTEPVQHATGSSVSSRLTATPSETVLTDAQPAHRD